MIAKRLQECHDKLNLKLEENVHMIMQDACLMLVKLRYDYYIEYWN